MRTHMRLWARSFSCSISRLALTVATLTVASLNPACMRAQAAAKPAASSDTSSGFSIETEMLTYRALESNSEAIACDIAAYLRGGTASFSSTTQGSACNVTGGGGSANSSVIVLPFDHNVYSDFQIWRSDMQTMAEFEKRGANACNAAPAPPPPPPSTPPGVGGRGLTAATPAAGAANLALSLMPGGNMLSAASGVLGLFASDQASSPVGGTIQDQAMMDNVSRELRAANVPVMMPSIYAPYAFSSIDPARSPFLIALDKLLHTRDCLVASKGATDADVKNIDEFLAALSSGPAAAPAKPAPAASASGSSAPAAPAAGAPAAAATPAAPAPSHLQSALTADGLAQRLGADPNTGLIPDTAPQHILLLKALESGGSVSRSSNIFGTKMSFSGGSVGTYALFDLNGQLECSGNVYDYAGYIPAKKFQAKLRAYTVSPGSQVIFQRGGCRTK